MCRQMFPVLNQLELLNESRKYEGSALRMVIKQMVLG